MGAYSDQQNVIHERQTTQTLTIIDFINTMRTREYIS